MAETTPNYGNADSYSAEASATIKARNCLEVSGARTVAPAAGPGGAFAGVAAYDVPKGELVTVRTTGVHTLRCTGDIAAGARVTTAPGGAVTVGEPAIGIAQSPSVGGAVRVKLIAPGGGSAGGGGGGASTVVDVFTANGTWTRRPGAVLVNVRVVGGGGSGAAGAKGPAGSALVGGGGGGPGGMSEATFIAADLPAFVQVSVGKGGAAVAGQSANSTAGANGNPGGTTTFGSGSAMFLQGWRGGGGTGGGTAAGGAGGFVGGGTSQIQGNVANGLVGGSGSVTGGPGGAAGWSLGASSGGGGGGVTAAGVAGDGGVGGYSNTNGYGGAKGGSGAVGANGYVSAVKGPGGGGGGGGASVTGNGFSGGSGGGFGGGGGGGGAALNDKGTSGGGGAGGDGICIVVTTIDPAAAAAALTEVEVASYTLQASDVGPGRAGGGGR